MNRPGPDREWLPERPRTETTKSFWRVVARQEQAWVQELLDRSRRIALTLEN